MKTLFFTLLLAILVLPTFATDARKQVVLRVTAYTGYIDQTTVYFDYGIVPAFVASQDAAMAFSTLPDQPALYSFSSDSVMCGLNGYSALTTSAVVELGLRIANTGSYVFTNQGLTGFDSSSMVLLYDRQLNIFTNLRNNFYPVTITDSGYINGRFYLYVYTPVVATFVLSGCANNNGIINITQDTTITYSTANLFDTAGTLITTLSNVSGAFSYSGLPEGVYTMALYYQNNYVCTETLSLGGNYVQAQILSMPLTASLEEPVTFHSFELNATNSFWAFGDSSQIEGVSNPTFAFYIPGVFTVVLTATDAAGCQATDSVIITVSGTTAVNNVATQAAKIWAYEKTITVTVTDQLQPGAEIKVYNMLGQPVYTGPVTQLTTPIALNNQTNGYYVVTLTNNSLTTTQTVLLMQ